MQIAGIPIADTFAEAFPMTGCRLIVTAMDEHWAQIAAQTSTGYACSVIGCDTEAGIERYLSPDETPDGRPGVALLFFSFGRQGLQKGVANRVGQCLMTCPTTACFAGLHDTEKSIELGSRLRYFGDGHQISKLLGGRRYWRIPTMDGEFLCEESTGVQAGIGGGNFMVLGRDQASALRGASAAIAAISVVPNVICPFPGGIVRSGSKVGSKYKTLKASTNDAFCPTLRGTAKSELPPEANACYEIVIDGFDTDSIEVATREGILAACKVPGVVAISAGNYGGKLGPHHFHLHAILK